MMKRQSDEEKDFTTKALRTLREKIGTRIDAERMDVRRKRVFRVRDEIRAIQNKEFRI